MNISHFFNPPNHSKKLFHIGFSANFPKRKRIDRLNADFQLKKSLSCLRQQCQALLIYKLSRNFKMEIGYSVIMCQQISP